MKFYVNDDQCAYFEQDNAAEKMNEKSLREHVDRYVDGGIDTIVFCSRGHRTNYRSQVVDAQWDPVCDGRSPLDLDHRTRAWAVNTKALFDAGIDPYEIWLDQCRKRKISGWLSIRMNDCHHANPIAAAWVDNRFYTRRDWRNFPEITPENMWDDEQYKIRDHVEYYMPLMPAICWNYAHSEVNKLMEALLFEHAERYDADAFELDFMRTPYCLRPGHQLEDAHFITELLLKFRKKLDEMEKIRGHHIAIAARVPLLPESAFTWGLDVKTWANLGIIDAIVPASFCRSFQYGETMQRWRRIVPDTVEIIPCLDSWIPSSPTTVNSLVTPEFVRGWCSNMASAGADSAYFFNFIYWCFGELGNKPLPGFDKFFQQKIDLAVMRRHTCRYQKGFIDFMPPGQPPVSELPRLLKPGIPVKLDITIGYLPPKGKLDIIPILDPWPDRPGLEIKLNGDSEPDFNSLKTGSNTVEVTSWFGGRLLDIFLDVTPE